MKQATFQISVSGEEQGPFTIDEIVKKLNSKEIQSTDYIYVDEKEDWILLMEHSEVVEALKSNKPAAPKPKKPTSIVDAKTTSPKAAESAAKKVATPKSDSKAKTKKVSKAKTSNGDVVASEWYVLKGENKFGPFQYPEVIRMLQEKIVFEFDFVWQNGMDKWTRVAEIEHFQPENIKKLQDSLMPEIKNVFFRRKHPRIPYDGRVFVRDGEKLWQGVAVEISAGGAGIVMENANVVPGEEINILFKSQSSLPAFNVVCEVVSKKFVDGVRDSTQPIRYGVKFKDLSGDTQKALTKFTKTGGMQAA